MKGKGKGYIALGITSIVWGTTWVASKIAVAKVPALQIASTRQFIAGSLLVLFFMLYKKVPFPTLPQFRWLIVMAFLMFVFANGFSMWGIQYIPAGLGALIGALYPLCVVIIEAVFFKTRNMSAITFAGLFLGIAGIGVVFHEHSFTGNNPNFFVGIFLSFIAMLAWSLGTVFLSRNKANINPYYGTGWQMLISSVVLFVMAQLTQKTVPYAEIEPGSWAIIAYLVIFGSVGAFVAFIYSTKSLPAAIASLYAYINPLVAMVAAAILLSEKLTKNILWGAIITLIGVFLVNYSIKKMNEQIIAEAEQ
jgi:drug/metabolite transporter (DMT)-like permease